MKIACNEMRLFVILLIILGSLSSCEDIFQYSPYDAHVSDRNVNEKNIEKIASKSVTDTLWFVAIADVHHWYDELKEATDKINTLSNISFVIVCGDITDEGIADEFEWYNRIMKNLKVPYITIIGNHDYRSNGKLIYEKMFGASNFTFDLAQYHFIGFDDVVWENGNTRPDFKWLNNSLSDTIQTIQCVFAHIPPWTDQLGLEFSELDQIITKNPHHVLVIHGHEHNYCYKHLHANHVVTGSQEHKELSVIGLCDTTFVLKRISY